MKIFHKIKKNHMQININKSTIYNLIHYIPPLTNDYKKITRPDSPDG
jgi:hypothetical protein